MFTDTHCHLFREYYDDIDKILSDAKDNNVTRYISAGTNYLNSLEMIDLSNNYNNVYCCIGIHPEDVNNKDNDKCLELIRNNAKNKNLVAIGEIGLDYYYGKDNKDKQIELFESQLKLAEDLNLPVVIHSREATLDTLNTIKKYNVKGVIHSYSGSVETAKEYIKLGFYFGVNGIMTFKNSKTDLIIKEIPTERLLLETDSPYLTPDPYRKYSNEPKYIKRIAEYLADIKNVTLEEISSITEENVHNVFDI